MKNILTLTTEEYDRLPLWLSCTGFWNDETKTMDMFKRMNITDLKMVCAPDEQLEEYTIYAKL